MIYHCECCEQNDKVKKLLVKKLKKKINEDENCVFNGEHKDILNKLIDEVFGE